MNQEPDCQSPFPGPLSQSVANPAALLAENKADPAFNGAPRSPARGAWGIGRHSRKCKICRHPEREDIEQDYRNWFTPAEIARHYEIDDSALHRHLNAMGLISSRRNNLQLILDRILERGAEKPISGDVIIRAVRAQACLTDDCRWVEPERKVVHIYETADKAGMRNQ